MAQVYKIRPTASYYPWLLLCDLPSFRAQGSLRFSSRSSMAVVFLQLRHQHGAIPHSGFWLLPEVVVAGQTMLPVAAGQTRGR
jgi:hypothetical protein